MLFYAAPIVYSPQVIPTEYQWILTINPMTYIINGYRDIFYYQQVPDITSLISLIGISIVGCVLGYIIFNKLQKGFAEEL